MSDQLHVPGSFTPGTKWIAGWVGPRTGLDAVKQRKISCSCRNLTLAVQPAARRYSDWAIPAPLTNSLRHIYTYIFVFLLIFYSAFIYDILNDNISNSECIASEGRIVNEGWVQQHAEEKGHDLIWGKIPEFSWRDWKNHETVCHDSRFQSTAKF
jgi:hypothetical protein